MITKISDSTKDRYSTLALVSSWDISIIHRAKILIIGAGALGNEVAKNLAMTGVESIYILDLDTVEIANISRSIFFRESDHGQLKANILCQRIKEVNPDIKTIPLVGPLEEILGLGLIRRMDIIFSCLDNRLARRTLNRMCQKVGKPWVDGSMENLLGEVTSYFPDDGPCYECYMTRIDKEIVARAVSCKGLAVKNISLGKVPTTPTMGSIISAVQVQEAFKILHNNFPQSCAGEKLIFNFQINDFYSTKKDRKNDCEGHFRYGEVTEKADWTKEKTTAAEILQCFQRETGASGQLLLGREIIIGMKCHFCQKEEKLVELLGSVSVERVICPMCKNPREIITTHKISEDEPYAEYTLEKLALPLLEVIEVKGNGNQKWYEITGDLQKLF